MEFEPVVSILYWEMCGKAAEIMTLTHDFVLPTNEIFLIVNRQIDLIKNNIYGIS